jgi:ATP-dependent Clp protease ATP-binding subunit ClpB
VTDAQGRTVNLKTVIIMTSKHRLALLLEGVTRPGITEQARTAVRSASALPAEFLNRVDDIVLFKPLMAEIGVSLIS